MSVILATIADTYNNIVIKNGDPRVENWFLMSSPFPTICLIIAYILFVQKIGPEFMKNRKAFELKNTMIVYNMIQMCYSAWVFYAGAYYGWMTGYSFVCEPVDYSDNPKALGMLKTHWWFFFSKFTEFLDTVFFILRKKQNQVTDLHVIHHALVPIIVWITVKYVGTGHFTFAGGLNSFVHFFMYGYYMLAAMGPSARKYLWWKKHLTILQLVQFVAVLLHAFIGLLGDCDIPKGFLSVVLFQGFLFYYLFSNFYKKTYTSSETEKLATRVVKQKPQNEEITKNPIKQELTYFQFLVKQLLGMCIPDQTVLMAPSSDTQDENYVKEADL